MKKYNVLIFPAGAENAIEIYESLVCNIHFNVFGASGKSDHASYLYPKENYIEDELYINTSRFNSKFNEILNQYKIDIVIPTHDTVALYLSEHRHNINALIATSPYETANIARNKRQTYELFKEYKFCPTIYDNPQSVQEFPVFLKPNVGEGSKGTKLVNKYVECQRMVDINPDLLICEYLPGDEITVDCFTDRYGKLRFVGPRTRERIQMGISFRSKTLPLTDEVNEIAKIINKKLDLRGAWFFQLKSGYDEKYKLMEVSVRQAGTMAVYRQKGVNFALLTLFDLLDYDIDIITNDMVVTLDRCLKNRYKLEFDYCAAYIDYDDTLIIDNQVNTDILKYIYQCHSKGIKVNLITKHEGALDESLKNHRICKDIFDKIIHLTPDEQKTNFISEPKSILIDNYFIERKEAKEKLNINVFDVDSIHALIE